MSDPFVVQPSEGMLPAAQDRPKSVAPAWHTILFVAVVLLFAALAARSQEAMVAAHGRVPMYLMTMAWEWLLVGYILWGARKRGARLRDVSGGKWSTPEEVLIDMAVAVGSGWYPY